MAECFRYTEEVGGSIPSRAYHLNPHCQRILGLDFFRGCVMFLLIAEATGLYDLLIDPKFEGTVLQVIGEQFHHHPWQGLRLWDLGLPFFLLISGVALSASAARRSEEGNGPGPGIRHALSRSALLLILGWALYVVNPVVSNPRGAFLYDVLPHIAIGGLVAYILLKRKPVIQWTFSIGLLLLTELLYRGWPVPGSGGPFTPDHNFGSYLDRLLTGEISDGHWVAFNIVPATAFLIWGALAGRLLMGPRPLREKLMRLVASGLVGVTAGLALCLFTPIIRRLCTSSFVLVSSGIGILALALAYWIVDGLKFRKIPLFFAVVGVNPLFIYLFAQSGGAEWVRRIVEPFTGALDFLAGGWAVQALTGFAVWALLWFLCFGLSRRGIRIRV